MFRDLKMVVSMCAAVALTALVACGGGEAGGTAGEQEASAEGTEAAQETEAAAQGQQMAMELPDGVTQEMVDRGDELFHGAGLCYTCHGQDAKGLPNLGTDLTDGEWIHGDGSYEFIISNIQTGVTAEESTSGTPMPPKGGSGITDEQIRAVAAYVWTLSHGGG